MLNLKENFLTLEAWSNRCSHACSLLSDVERNISDTSPDTSLIIPDERFVFEAFKRTSYDGVKAVIIGQDPYFNRVDLGGRLFDQAMGLAFSVPEGIRPPPSLKNIYKELEASIEGWRKPEPEHGDLSAWSSDVLLLNTSLTVEHGSAGSHSKVGWVGFTQSIISELILREEPLVFLAWGRHAHKAVEQAEGTHHLVVKTSHPSPLGATKSGSDFDAFLGSHCFAKANEFLANHQIPVIDWSL